MAASRRAVRGLLDLTSRSLASRGVKASLGTAQLPALASTVHARLSHSSPSPHIERGLRAEAFHVPHLRASVPLPDLSGRPPTSSPRVGALRLGHTPKRAAAPPLACGCSSLAIRQYHTQRQPSVGSRSPAAASGSALTAGLRPPSPSESQAMVPFGARGQSRGFWRLRNMRNSGVPFIVQVFYGTLAMMAIGVILFTVLSLSAGAAVLLFLAYLGFRFGARQPQTMARALQHPPSANTPMGMMFRPLFELLADSTLFEGLREVRGTIEHDVLQVINTHKELARYGNDFIPVNHHKMSMQVVNGSKMVVLEFPVISTKPHELVVQVIAKQNAIATEQGRSTGGAADGIRWEYESVTVSPGDQPPIDLTGAVGRGSGGRVIDAKARVKKESKVDL